RLVRPWHSSALNRLPGNDRRRSVFRPRLEGLEDRNLLNFGSPTLFAVGGEPVPPLVGDFNNDGNPDLAVPHTNHVFFASGTSSTRLLTVLLGNGVGTFRNARLTDPMQQLAYRQAADLTGDGKADLLAIQADPNILVVLPGNGDGTFQAPQAIAGVPG